MSVHQSDHTCFQKCRRFRTTRSGMEPPPSPCSLQSCCGYNAASLSPCRLLPLSYVNTFLSTGGGASGLQEDPPPDHHLRLEEGHAGGSRRPEGGGCRPQVSDLCSVGRFCIFLLSRVLNFLSRPPAVSIATTHLVSKRTS